MSNTIKLKRGSGSDPSASDLVVGELAIRTDSGKIFTKKDNGSVAEISGGGGIDDGDKGDITVSNGGDTFTIDNGVVTTAKIAQDAVDFTKLQNISTNVILGRNDAGTGITKQLSTSEVRTLINVEDGATADQTASEIVSLISGQNIAPADITSTGNLTLTSTDAGSSAAPEFELYRNSASPADADYLGQIKFTGEDAADNKQVYAKITGKASDVTNATEDGILEFMLTKAGSNNIAARFTSTDLKLINGTGLEVAGGSVLLGNGGASVQWGDTSTLGQLSFTATNGNPIVRAVTGKALVFQVDMNTTAMTLLSNGNVSVGADIVVGGTVDGVDIAARNTLFGGLTSSSGVLTNGVTATTQSAGDNSTKVATTAYTDTAISNLVDSAPGTLNTLNELAAALGDDANFSTTVTNSIATKLPLAGGTLTGNVIHNDNVKALFGTGSDLEIFHNGSQSYLNSTNGPIELRHTVGGANEALAKFNPNGSVQLFNNGSAKLETSSSGVSVTGSIVVSGTVDGRDVATDGTKLDTIESNATADQTASEILSLLSNQNITTSGLLNTGNATLNRADITVVTDGSRNNGVFIEAGDTGAGNRPNLVLKGAGSAGLGQEAIQVYYNNGSNKTFELNYNGDIEARNISLTAGADITGLTTIVKTTSSQNESILEVKHSNLTQGIGLGYNTISAIGSNSAVNLRFESKGAGEIYMVDKLNALAALDVTGSIVVSGTVDGRDLATDGTKLDGIESNATADQTASEILTLIKTVDGAGSGLNADNLDGQEGSYYRNASNINAGTISDARLPNSISSSITGNAATATKLATARTIAGVSFDGSANISLNNNAITNGAGYITASNAAVTNKLPLAGGTLTGHLLFGNNVFAKFGNSSQFAVGHDNSNALLSYGTGTLFATGSNFRVVNNGVSENILWAKADAEVELYYNNSLKFETSSSGCSVFGSISVSGTVDGRDIASDGSKLDGIASGATNVSNTNQLTNGAGFITDLVNDTSPQLGGNLDTNSHEILLDDNHAVKFGASSDLQIYHNSSLGNSWITNSTGVLNIRSDGFAIRAQGDSASYINITDNAEVNLYYNNSKKFETTNTGVSVTGTCAATSFSGDGSNLTGISAGATGGGSDECFYENDQTVTTNYTITNGKNAMAAGPLTINSGVTVTVGSGETLTIV